jgi:hypothetical protein
MFFVSLSFNTWTMDRVRKTNISERGNIYMEIIWISCFILLISKACSQSCTLLANSSINNKECLQEPEIPILDVSIATAQSVHSCQTGCKHYHDNDDSEPELWREWQDDGVPLHLVCVRFLDEHVCSVEDKSANTVWRLQRTESFSWWVAKFGRAVVHKVANTELAVNKVSLGQVIL